MSTQTANPAWAREADHLSAGDFFALMHAGTMSENDRVELVEGKIIQMSPMGGEHFLAVTNLMEILYANLDIRQVRLSSGGTLRLGEDTLVDPDAMVTERSVKGVPQSRDVYLLVEVSKSTLAYDKGEKRRLYAKHGIAEYWIVNLVQRQLEVYSRPNLQTQEFLESSVWSGDEEFAPQIFPALRLTPNEILAGVEP